MSPMYTQGLWCHYGLWSIAKSGTSWRVLSHIYEHGLVKATGEQCWKWDLKAIIVVSDLAFDGSDNIWVEYPSCLVLNLQLMHCKASSTSSCCCVHSLNMFCFVRKETELLKQKTKPILMCREKTAALQLATFLVSPRLAGPDVHLPWRKFLGLQRIRGSTWIETWKTHHHTWPD